MTKVDLESQMIDFCEAESDTSSLYFILETF